MSTDNTSDPRREALIKLGKYAAYATPVVTDEELTPTVSDEALEDANKQRPGAYTNPDSANTCCFYPPSPGVSRDR